MDLQGLLPQSLPTLGSRHLQTLGASGTTSLEEGGSGARPSLLVHVWIPWRLKVKPELSPPLQTGLPARGAGQHGPALNLCTGDTAWPFGASLGAWATGRLPRSTMISTNRPEGQLPGQLGGNGKSQWFCGGNIRRCAPGRGAGAGEGPSPAASPPRRWPSRR